MVSDMDLRKMYPNVNRFEDNAKKASWSVVTLNSPNDIIFNFVSILLFFKFLHKIIY